MHWQLGASTAWPEAEAAGGARVEARADRTAVRIFATALAVRVGFFSLTGRYLFRTTFGFGWEAGRIASALAEGRGFSDPFFGATGPTAWIAPGYPFVLAAIFKVFGTYSAAAGWVTLAFNSACSAAVALILLELGRELVDERVGRTAGWTWALLPYAVYWPTRVVFDTNLTACLLALVLLLTLRLGRAPSAGRWAAFGIVWAALALTNPAALAFAPASWVWVGLEQRRQRSWRPAAALAAGALCLACVAPWLVRNDRTFGAPVFIRGNFGAELRLGNGPDGAGEWMFWLHPAQNAQELARYRALGERAYAAEREREALAFIAGHPGLFALNTVRRVYWFWCGTTRGEAEDPLTPLRTFAFTAVSVLAFAGLARLLKVRRREGALLAALLLCFPAVYYVTFVVTRYRHPIEPEMVLLAVYALLAAADQKVREKA